MQVNISDTSLFSNGFHYMCGNFKGDLLVNDQAYFSEGGYDYFILKLSEEEISLILGVLAGITTNWQNQLIFGTINY